MTSSDILLVIIKICHQATNPEMGERMCFLTMFTISEMPLVNSDTPVLCKIMTIFCQAKSSESYNLLNHLQYLQTADSYLNG